VIGSAVAMKILFGLPLWAGVLVTALDTFTFLIISYYGVRKLELFFAFLVSIMAISFAVCFGISSPDFSGILKGTIVPSCSVP
jgi:natural resistance-associated macrophage protein